ncbi:uncharacterized protein [Rutidosis leptorrhynchoides]|uniref:uncharacterized protein n=1 Tax=Rutidosis leptorrhynchoides TaxID=125765 RepID=UPI003A9A5F42
MDEKRRLPSWMFNRVTKPLDLDKNDDVIKDKLSDVTESLKPKAKRVTRNKKENVDESMLVKCETKRKRRGSVEEDAIECRDHEEEVVEKRKQKKVGRKVEDQSLRKKMVNEDAFENGDECQGFTCDEDDEELTMEDLISIAKEFVENDESDTVQQKSTERQRGSKSKSSYTSVAAQTTLISPHDIQSDMPEKTTSHHDFFENTTSKDTTSHHDSLENTTSKVTPPDTSVETRVTDDPAQDMLELFLGPLLKKPPTIEEASSINDSIISCDIKTQKHDVISSKQVSITKKKSSLRDTVAMLLD